MGSEQRVKVADSIRLMYSYMIDPRSIYYGPPMDLVDLDQYVARIAKRLRYRNKSKSVADWQVYVLTEIIRRGSWQAAAYI